MAAIERGQGASDTVVKGWLARALTVPRGPQWICDNCQHIHAEWQPTCSNCKSLDTLTWRTPPVSEVAMPGGVQMLPLIVGALKDKADVPAEVDAPAEPEAPVVVGEVVSDPPEDSEKPKADAEKPA
jgi:HemY protein